MRFPARVSRSRSKSLRRRKLRFELRGVAVMTEEHAPNEGAMKIAEEGIRGMINALGAEVIAPDVMIDAALHILAAWIASSQTNRPQSARQIWWNSRRHFLRTLSIIAPRSGFLHRSAQVRCC